MKSSKVPDYLFSLFFFMKPILCKAEKLLIFECDWLLSLELIYEPFIKCSELLQDLTVDMLGVD